MEVVLRPYNQAGREGEGREDMAEKGKRSHLVFRGGGGGRRADVENPPPSRLNRVALNGHVGDR
jgi:hypothetical protein